jgi:Asp-tRNA(Asn)/Glu-tRNA(Gln) amidotransferase A subunit family amidase
MEIFFNNSRSIGLAMLLAALGARAARADETAPFRVEEATIAEIHAALRARTLTCQQLVERYLRRIDAYDKDGPALNSIVVVNLDALKRADEIDARPAGQGLIGPLHCIPVIVKDNFETVDLPTTAGSLSLKGYMASKDAFQVKRIRDAGAIVLAKSNMAEFAFSPYETVNSILPGYTRNPYALDRVTAGSSGGTAAAVAASFGAVGLGTDTGNSIRGPSSHQALVGIRATMGLASRAGVVPLNLSADVAGPMARTVADAVAVLQVVAGEDADDPVTAAGRGHVDPDYARHLVRDGLRGARIGVLRQAYESPTLDAEVRDLFTTALEDLRRQGAVVIDPIMIEGLDEKRAGQTGTCTPFKFDLNRFLAARADRVPVKSLEEIIQLRRFHPAIEHRLVTSQEATQPPEESPACRSREEFRGWLREAVFKAMEAGRLDALVYPTWSNPPRLIGDLNTPHGDNSQLFSPSTGFPALTVPMGYLRGGVLPSGLQMLGRPWSEGVLIRLAYAYEQATRHRRPPTTVPPLRRE